MLFNKDHVSFMVNPAARSAYLYGGIRPDLMTEMEVKVKQGHLSEHSPLNTTVLPDDFLRSFQPIFLIRHPALLIPSRLRAHHDTLGREHSKTELDLIMSLHWQRDLWQFYAEKPTVELQTNGHIQFPIILDADDIIRTRSWLLTWRMPWDWILVWSDSSGTRLRTIKMMIRKSSGTGHPCVHLLEF